MRTVFSKKYWGEFKPLLLNQPKDPYFYIDSGCICSKWGWKCEQLMYIDVEMILQRKDIVKEATEYAKENSLPVPTQKDIEDLDNLLDYYEHYFMYSELSREQYDEWALTCPKALAIYTVY